ncbi:NADPH-dependent FMN reductase [Kaistia soli]|uniref:NADPH-dependent FMN reductase n=1 Tax=Kaistia soli TaxID=446684 RepID=UPI001FCD43D3|nr:NAD(P)H-dependent oxidoreductase [Kaistia soli]
MADWVSSLGASVSDVDFQTVDLRDLQLGLDDEPDIPAAGRDYRGPATRRWSELVQGAGAIVFVSPQYNWGYPAALKNAIDHLYREWRSKPVLIVTYGGHGGGKCGAQLREVLGGLDVILTDAMPALRLARARIVANDGAIDPDIDFADQREEVLGGLRELVAKMSELRAG